jgi:hypothetical protein
MTMGATTLLASACPSLWADNKVNPYEAIVERNPFALKDPPPPPPPEDPSTKAPPAPLATVELTGILNILGPPQALLEIIPGPGKPMLKPVLREGERVESVEVVSIDIQKNEVTIKNGLTVTNLTFKVAKSAPPTPTPPVPGIIPGKPAVPVPQPTQTSYNNNQGSGRYNVMVAGGSAAPASYGGAQNTGAAGYTGVNPSGANLTGGTDGGFRSIPSRNLRSNPQAALPTMSPEEQVIEIEKNQMLNERLGRVVPPLPPTPLNPTRNVVLPPLPGQQQ